MKARDESTCIPTHHTRYSGCYHKSAVCRGLDGINGFLIGEFELTTLANPFTRVYVSYIYLGASFHLVVIMITERRGFENRAQDPNQ
jgi:hypothetical protein